MQLRSNSLTKTIVEKNNLLTKTNCWKRQFVDEKQFVDFDFDFDVFDFDKIEDSKLTNDVHEVFQHRFLNVVIIWQKLIFDIIIVKIECNNKDEKLINYEKFC